MRKFATALCVAATALMAAPATLNAADENTVQWWRVVVLQEKNPRCVTVEGNLFCPSGVPQMIITYEPVSDQDTLRKIRDAGKVASVDGQ